MEAKVIEDDPSIRSKVLLFDDEEEKRGKWAEQLGSLIGTENLLVCHTSEMREAVAQLEERRARVRRGDDPDLQVNAFDRARILVVDFDLFEVERTLDGHHVAYLARCFSRAGLIVGVNQDDTERWFDLTLTDHPYAHTDVSLGAQHLAIPALWQPESKAGDGTYRPWAWPVLDRAAEELEACVAAVDEVERTTTVTELVGIDREHQGLLSRDLLLPVSPRGSDQPVPAQLAQLLSETPLGLAFTKDRVPSAFDSRVIATRIRHWLEGIILPRQDTLVDAPHLAAEMPGLLDPEDLSGSRAATTKLHVAPSELGFPHGALAECAGPAKPWVSRPTWWRPDYMSSAALDEYRRAHANSAGFVFCEDTSSWESQEQSRRFRAGTGGTTSQRWIRCVVGDDGRLVADYEPAGRLLA